MVTTLLLARVGSSHIFLCPWDIFTGPGWIQAGIFWLYGPFWTTNFGRFLPTLDQIVWLKGSKFLKVGVTQNLVQVRLGHCKAKDSARQILGWTKARPNPIFSYIYTSSDSTQFISAENCFRDRKIFPVAINVSECSAVAALFFALLWHEWVEFLFSSKISCRVVYN